ncbi:matrixin family metalloprotease [Methanolapillus millepedarum]
MATASPVNAYQAMDWKWEDSNITLTYTLEGEGAIPPEWVEPLNAAQETWNEAGSAVHFSNGENGNNVYLTQMPAGYANKIGLVWISMPPNPSNANVTPPAYNSSDVPLRYKYVEIIFNINTTEWTTNGSRTGPDVQGVATHEFGHVLGLDHNTKISTSETIMVPSGSDTIALRKLKSDDIAGVRALYPKTNAGASMETSENNHNESTNTTANSGNNPGSGNTADQNEGAKKQPIFDWIILNIKDIWASFK